MRSATLIVLLVASSAFAEERLPGTKALTQTGDFSALMLAGMEKRLLAETQAAREHRKAFWKGEKSVEPNRARLRRMIGVVDERLPLHELELVGGTSTPSEVARTERYVLHAVRWPVLDGVHGEGLLYQPTGKPLARIVALPDADQTPESLAWARRLAENGCQVVVPVLIDRQDTWSGNPKIVMLNAPHREWVYRPAFDLGRHVIGYEVQKVLALIDWFRAEDAKVPIGVAGYGEGGLIAFYSAAVDRRIDASLVSGYFNDRDRLWDEPIYRNVFGLLREFGDAEIVNLIAPRPLVIEHCEFPKVDGPPVARQGRSNYAAPGRLRTPSLDVVRKEIQRVEERTRDAIKLIDAAGPGSEDAILAFLTSLGRCKKELLPEGKPPGDARKNFDPAPRQKRQLQELVDHTQTLMHRSAEVRRAFWSKPGQADLEHYRTYLADEIIGRFDNKRLAPNPHSRKIHDKEKWTGYEVKLDVFGDVFLWGILLVPKDLKPGEKRPVVVCQHGLEGLPEDVINEDRKSQAYASYKAFAARLAERGFIVFAPHHYYRGGNRFRSLQRIAHPLGKTLFAFVVAQHEQLHDWLATLPFVDASRIGFYGLSYGGFSAQRLPALVKRYALSINSAEFNDMVLKKSSVHDKYSYPFYNTFEVFEWDMANTFNYSDLAALIAPRPFMVERGHSDSVAPDEWVAAEYAKVRRHYVQLGIGERTTIEFFDGPHTINGVGTFAFLHKHLNFPERKR